MSFHLLRWCHQIWQGYSRGLGRPNFVQLNAIYDHQSDFEIHFLQKLLQFWSYLDIYFFKVPKRDQATTKY